MMLVSSGIPSFPLHITGTSLAGWLDGPDQFLVVLLNSTAHLNALIGGWGFPRAEAGGGCAPRAAAD